MRTISIATTPNTQTSLSPIGPVSSPAVLSSGAQRSPWHSPVPYLFGGLAAMLGVIAFALLILACSYLKLSGGQENREGRDLESGGGEKERNTAIKESAKIYEEKVLVIMAGEERPTFLATPVSAKIVALDDGIGKDGSKEGIGKKENSGENQEKERSDHDQVTDQQERIEETAIPANQEHYQL